MVGIIRDLEMGLFGRKRAAKQPVEQIDHSKRLLLGGMAASMFPSSVFALGSGNLPNGIKNAQTKLVGDLYVMMMNGGQNDIKDALMYLGLRVPGADEEKRIIQAYQTEPAMFYLRNLARTMENGSTQFARYSQPPVEDIKRVAGSPEMALFAENMDSFHNVCHGLPGQKPSREQLYHGFVRTFALANGVDNWEAVLSAIEKQDEEAIARYHKTDLDYTHKMLAAWSARMASKTRFLATGKNLYDGINRTPTGFIGEIMEKPLIAQGFGVRGPPELPGIDNVSLTSNSGKIVLANN